MRIEDNLLDIFSAKAAAEKLTQVEYFEKMINDSNKGKILDYMSAQLNEKDKEILQLEKNIQRLEKITGKKLPTLRKISFKVNDEQFEYLDALAHELKIPKNQLMQKLFLKPKENKPKTLELS